MNVYVSMNAVVSGDGEIEALLYIFYGMILCLLQRPSSDMDESYGPDRPATAEVMREYERLRDLWQAEQECVKATTEAEEWLPISISRARGQNSTDAVESKLADLEISAFTEEKHIDFLVDMGADDGARGPTPPPEQDKPKLVPRRVEPYEEYLRRGLPTKRPPPVTGPIRRRRIRGRREPASPPGKERPEEVQMDPLADWPSTRHVQPQTAFEPESADVAILTWRGIDIGPATATEAQVVEDILAIIRDTVLAEEKERRVRAMLGQSPNNDR